MFGFKYQLRLVFIAPAYFGHFTSPNGQRLEYEFSIKAFLSSKAIRLAEKKLKDCLDNEAIHHGGRLINHKLVLQLPFTKNELQINSF